MAVRTPNALSDSEKRLLTPKSSDADLLAAAALAQQVGATATADELMAQARENRLNARRARNLADVYAATNYEFDEAM